jgi:hypothetical protein
LGGDPPAWQLTFTAPARRDLRRLDPPIARRVLGALENVVADPDRAQLRQLVNRPEQRLRVAEPETRLVAASLYTAHRCVRPRSRV